MKAEELMVGDLVYYSYANPFVTKVIDVCSHGEEPFIRCKRDEKDNLYKQGQLEDFHVGILRPIPLTLEILEKNGYSYNENREAWEQIPNDGFGICKDIDDNCFYFCVGIFDAFNRYSDITYHDITKIEYVHELQHALKLCGIEKEIIL